MTDEQRDDEILGRALSRAIETQTPSETPYERSRIAVRPQTGGPGFLALSGIAAALLLAVALVSWFTRPISTLPVGSSASPSAANTDTPAATASAALAPVRTFFVRDLLPPVSAYVASQGAHTPVDNIRQRLSRTREAATSAVPGGAANPLASVMRGGHDPAFDVRIDADIATVTFDVNGDWGVRGAAQVQALVQQLVYVITEEPGIRKARIIERGKTNAVIDGLVVDRPLSREDVTDYDQPGSTQTAQGFGDSGPAGSRKLTTSTSVETVAPGLARFTIATDLQNVGPTQVHPDFKVEVLANDETNVAVRGKWRMRVSVNGIDSTAGQQTIDRSPLRTVSVSVCQGCAGVGTIYELGLDDLRPWRTALEFNPVRIIIDIGGDPRMLAGDNAVYAPGYGATVARTFQVSGIEHNFEAHVDIRVKDDRDREILRTVTTGTNCCDPGGTFTATVNLPASVNGRIYLEVYQASPKDGSDTALIRIPLTVR